MTRWTQIKLKNPIPCDECAAVQHETDGACGPRADAKSRRTLDLGRGGKHVLNLCHQHAQLWRERDETDTGVRR